MQNHLSIVVQLGMTGRLGLDRKQVGSTAEQLRLRDSMLADLRTQNKALAGQHALLALRWYCCLLMQHLHDTETCCC